MNNEFGEINKSDIEDFYSRHPDRICESCDRRQPGLYMNQFGSVTRCKECNNIIIGYSLRKGGNLFLCWPDFSLHKCEKRSDFFDEDLFNAQDLVEQLNDLPSTCPIVLLLKAEDNYGFDYPNCCKTCKRIDVDPRDQLKGNCLQFGQDDKSMLDEGEKSLSMLFNWFLMTLKEKRKKCETTGKKN